MKRYKKYSIEQLLELRTKWAIRLEELDKFIASGYQAKEKPKISVKNPTLLWHTYVIRCEDDFYYIGITTNLNSRLKKHQAGKGSWFTRLHKPIEYVETHKVGLMPTSEAAKLENKLAAQYIIKYGVDAVRGGCFIQRDKRYWEKKIPLWL